MKLWIDCEFNSYLGELISLALVDEDGRQFYRVLEISEPVNPWVAEHVMPILCASPIPLAQFHAELESFLMQYESVHVIADWPEDIAHLMHALITGPGERLNTPPLTMEVVRIDAPSKVPHNALWDAIGIRDYMQEHPAPAGGGAGDSEPMFYIQDTRSYVGNCVLWWCPDGNGYTTRIDEAGKFTELWAKRQQHKRDTDKPWPCELVDSIVRPTIDMQDLHKITAKPGAEGV